MTVQAWFSGADVDVAPGSIAVLPLTVANLGNSTESFTLTATGLGASWTTVRPAYVTLFGGSSQVVDVEVHPPRLPSTTAGPTSLGIRIVPQLTPDEVENVETTLLLEPTYDRKINMLQPALRSRRRAVYELMVENQGNTQASCRMHLLEPTGRIDGDFDPPAVGVEPGGSTLVRLKVRASRRQWERRSRSIPFVVEADQQGSPGVSARASFVQAPMLPERLWWRLLALLVVAGAVTGAWFGLLKPAIERAADDAAADFFDTAAPATTISNEVTAPTTTAATTDGPALETPIGEAFDTTLAPGAARDTEQSQEYTVPADRRLSITDIYVQNPFEDQGVATIRRGGTILKEIQLADAVPDFLSRFSTGIELQPGEALSFSVQCAEIGRQGAAACSTTLLVSGLLLPVLPSDAATDG